MPLLGRTAVQAVLTAVLVATFAISCGVHQSWAKKACPSEATLRSVASTQRTGITFKNRRSGAIKIFWINYHGHRKFYHSLASGESGSFNTFATHPWIVTDASGHCIGVYFADVGENHITIGNSSTGEGGGKR
jgi:hypothetical protein